MGRPSADQARDRRRDILDTALDLFAEHGFHGTSMRALASAVGVRESALYHHFPSKSALLAGVIADYTIARSSEFESEMKAFVDRSLEEILTVFAQRLLAVMQSPHYQKLLRIMLVDRGVLDSDEDSWQRLSDEPRKAIARIHQQLRRTGKIRDDVEVEIFHLHFAAPLLLASNVLFGEGRLGPAMSLSKFVRQHVAFMVHALAPPKTRSKPR